MKITYRVIQPLSLIITKAINLKKVIKTTENYVAGYPLGLIIIGGD